MFPQILISVLLLMGSCLGQRNEIPPVINAPSTPTSGDVWVKSEGTATWCPGYSRAEEFNGQTYCVAVAVAANPRPLPPSFIKVGPFKYRVILHDGYFQCGDVKLAVGCEDPEQLKITVKSGMSLATEQVTLWHEVKHANDRTFIVSGEGEDFSDEDWVEHSSPGEFQILQENPDLVVYLTAKWSDSGR